MEGEVIKLLGKSSGTVIACGGGVVTRDFNYDPLHQNGTVVYLKRDLSKLSSKGRPLSARYTAEELYAARREAYERFADIEISSTEIPEKTAKVILSALGFEISKGEDQK